MVSPRGSRVDMSLPEAQPLNMKQEEDTKNMKEGKTATTTPRAGVQVGRRASMQ